MAKVVVSGATGLLGHALCQRLREAGHTVFRLLRAPVGVSGTDLYWDPTQFFVPEGLFSQVDVVIHLGGASIAEGRWTASRKKVLWESRIQSTRVLVHHILQAKNPSLRFLCASAIGYYGTSAVGDETAGLGTGFLAELCAAWEAETHVLAVENIQTISLRLGVVVSSLGGALAKMLPMFQLGLGGSLGSGQQWLSWISLEDAVSAIMTLMLSDHTGPSNIVSPNPIQQREMAQILAAVLYKRSGFFPLWPGAFCHVPAGALRMALGDMASETVLASQKIIPQVLLDRGFVWRDITMAGALERCLGD